MISDTGLHFSKRVKKAHLPLHNTLTMQGDLTDPYVLNLGTSCRLIVGAKWLLNYNHGKKFSAP